MKISSLTAYKSNFTRLNNSNSLSQSFVSQNFGSQEPSPDPNKLERNKVLYAMTFLTTLAIAGVYGFKKGWFTRSFSKASKEPVEVKPDVSSGLVTSLEEGMQKIKENNQIFLDKTFLLDFGKKAYDGYEKFSGGADNFWKMLNEVTPSLPESNKTDLITQMFHLRKHANFEHGNTLSIYKTPEGNHRNTWGIIEKQIDDVFA